jgi:hypothetical protein
MSLWNDTSLSTGTSVSSWCLHGKTEEQDRHCLYNVTLKSLHVTLFSWRSNKYYIFRVCLCSCIHSALNVPLMLSVACPTLPCFSTLLHKWHDFWTCYWTCSCVSISSATFIWNISYSKKNAVRYYHKSTQVFMYCTCYSCEILIRIELFGQFVFK